MLAPTEQHTVREDEVKIAFYNDHHYWGGLANNGGSRTILLSAKTLNEMGHEAVVVTHHDKFTWFKHPKPVRKVPKDADVVVAVSISDVHDLVCGPVSWNQYAYWARPYETWQMDMEQICALLRKLVQIEGIILVNSEWQQKELAAHGIDSTVVYQGYDMPPGGISSTGVWEKPHYIGCQYSTKTRKRWHDFAVLREALGDQDYCYVAFGDEPYKAKWLTTYLRHPSREQLTDFYRGCHFFFCPNSLEGLYNPAVEAALCGSLLVVSSRPKNGMVDFCDNTTAEMYYLLAEAAQCIRNPHTERVQACQQRITEKIGTRRRNMIRLVEVLSA